MKQENKRTIERVLDLVSGKEIKANEFFKKPIGHIFQMRTKIEEQIKTETPQHVCYFCKQRVVIRGQVQGIQTLHFAHLKDSEDCHIKTNSKYTEKEILIIKYNGAKESKAHHNLKWSIANYLEKDECATDVKVEKIYKDKAISKKWKRPDISAIYKNIKLVFEIQLSTTFLSVIVERKLFYQERQTFLLWVFDSFEQSELRKFTQSDIYYNNNYNAFVFDEEAQKISQQQKELYLYCHYQTPFRNGYEINWEWKRKYVTLQDLTFDEKNYLVYYYDAQAEKDKLTKEIEKDKFYNSKEGRLERRFEELKEQSAQATNEIKLFTLEDEERRRYIKIGLFSNVTQLPQLEKKWSFIHECNRNVFCVDSGAEKKFEQSGEIYLCCHYQTPHRNGDNIEWRWNNRKKYVMLNNLSFDNPNCPVYYSDAKAKEKKLIKKIEEDNESRRQRQFEELKKQSAEATDEIKPFTFYDEENGQDIKIALFHKPELKPDKLAVHDKNKNIYKVYVFCIDGTAEKRFKKSGKIHVCFYWKLFYKNVYNEIKRDWKRQYVPLKDLSFNQKNGFVYYLYDAQAAIDILKKEIQLLFKKLKEQSAKAINEIKQFSFKDDQKGRYITIGLFNNSNKLPEFYEDIDDISTYNYNVFCLDDEAEKLFNKLGKIHLCCHYQVSHKRISHNIKCEWKSKYVTLQDLKFDKEKGCFYYYDPQKIIDKLEKEINELRCTKEGLLQLLFEELKELSAQAIDEIKPCTFCDEENSRDITIGLFNNLKKLPEYEENIKNLSTYNYNVFCLDDEAEKLFKKLGKIHLHCWFKKPKLKNFEVVDEWLEDYISLDELRFRDEYRDDDGVEIGYFFDVDSTYLDICAEMHMYLTGAIIDDKKHTTHIKKYFEYVYPEKTEIEKVKKLYKKDVKKLAYVLGDSYEEKIIWAILLIKLEDKQLINKLIKDFGLQKTVTDILSLKIHKIIGYKFKKQIQIAYNLLNFRPAYAKYYQKAMEVESYKNIEGSQRELHPKINEIINQVKQEENNPILDKLFPELKQIE